VRAYGLRGMVSFALEKIQLPASKTRYVNRAVRFLTRLITIKYELRPGYRDPVFSGIRNEFPPASQWPTDGTTFAGDESL
jgi:hypothetical protein